MSCCNHCSLTKNNCNTSLHSRLSMVDFEKIHSLCPRPSSFWTTGLNSFMIHDHDSTSIPETDGKGVVVGKNLTSSLWTIYGLSFLIRATKLGESASIESHYTGKTDLKLDPLGFLTLISKLQWCSPF